MAASGGGRPARMADEGLETVERAVRPRSLPGRLAYRRRGEAGHSPRSAEYANLRGERSGGI